MNKIIDYRRAALLYLAVPVIIFLFNWYIPVVALPLSIGIIYCIFCFPVAQPQPISKKTLIASIAVILVWMYLSGIGGYMFQNPDHPYRNAVLRDLVNCEWPVVYNGSESNASMLCYYFAYWIPAALVGKAFGLAWAQHFLYIWTVAGLLLFVRLFDVTKGKHAFFLLLFLIFFGGLDLVPFISWHAAEYRPWSHIDGWSMYQYSSLTTCLFWVYNQALPAWICTVMMINSRVTLAQKAFIAALLFSFSPFPFIGIVAYVCMDYAISAFRRYQSLGKINRWLAAEAESILGKRQWILIFISIALVSFLSAFFGCTGRGFSVYILDSFNWKAYFKFCIVEFLVPCLLMLWYRYEVRRVSIIAFFLLILPLVQFVSIDDFVMRVSVPYILILAYTFFNFILSGHVRKNKYLFSLCIAYLAVCSAVPLSEILRSLKETYQGHSVPHYIESLPDSPGKGKLNFTSTGYQESFYFKNIMKRPTDTPDIQKE